MYGTTVGKFCAVTPNQLASVAAYCSTDVVGISVPRPFASSFPPNASDGNCPQNCPPRSDPPELTPVPIYEVVTTPRVVRPALPFGCSVRPNSEG